MTKLHTKRFAAGIPAAGLALALLLTPVGAQVGTPGASLEATPASGEIEIALNFTDGDEIGTATITEADGKVTIQIDVEESDLEPGEHGVHLHATGICDPETDKPFSSANGHFNPTDAVHGGMDDHHDGMDDMGDMEDSDDHHDGTPGAMDDHQGTPDDTDARHGGMDDKESHAGDLGNLTVEDQGAISFEATTDRVTLAAGGETSLHDEDGTALVIHANEDDLETDPAGDSGPRLVCGVVFAPENAPAPAAGGASDAVTIVSGDIFFDPEEITIPAETDVTFTLPNEGVAMHTFTIEELGIDVDLDPGATEEIVVNAPAGEYEYVCTIPGHAAAGMIGTLIVE